MTILIPTDRSVLTGFLIGDVVMIQKACAPVKARKVKQSPFLHLVEIRYHGANMAKRVDKK